MGPLAAPSPAALRARARSIGLAALSLVACGGRGAAIADRGDVCTDVGAVRACWTTGSGAHGRAEGSSVVSFARAVPTGMAPEAGWRCQGGGDSRACVDRARATKKPFVCEGERCVQAHPRLPDDGEWECVDLDGVVVCRGGAAPAGVVAGAPDTGWICGTRTGSKDRVCVDMAPDMPGGEARGFACSFVHDRGGARTCVKKEGAPRIGGVCGAGAPCPRGAVCSEGVCLPRAPKPDCWVDPDCGAGRVCAFGTCGSTDG